jgi:HSP20 family protein
VRQPTVWDPFRELEEMSNRLDRVFDDRDGRRGLDRRESLAATDWSPADDIEETAEQNRL